MLRIKPFKGIRPVPALADKVAIYPNNLMNEDERKEEARKNPISFAHVVKPRIDFPENVAKTDEKLFEHARNYFGKMLEEKTLLQDSGESYYIYRQMLEGRTQTGLIVSYHVSEYLNGRIKKHENTRPEKESENVQHILATGIQGNPLFLAYNPVSAIDTYINQLTAAIPDYHFKSDFGVYHTLWVISSAEAISKLSELFNENVKESYIADGHHRAASSAMVAEMMKQRNPHHKGDENYNYLLSCLFPSNQLKIYDYNRVVKDLNGAEVLDLVGRVGEKFTVEEVNDSRLQPQTFHEFGMHLNDKWYRLTAKPGSYLNDPVNVLDVSILQNNLLKPLLGIDDPRTDKRIDFIAGTKGIVALEKKVAKGKAAIAFTLYPVSMQQLFDVSDAGEVMPPKSTWFEPKLLSGLVIYRML